MEFPETTLDRFTKIAAVFSIVIVFLGFVNLFFYYKAFNIEIFEYLSVSEVITTSFSFFTSLVIVSIFSSLIVWLILRTSWIYHPQKKVSYNYFFIISFLFVPLLILIKLIKVENVSVFQILSLLYEILFMSFLFTSVFHTNYMSSLKDEKVVERKKIASVNSIKWTAIQVVILYFFLILLFKISFIKYKNITTSTSTFFLSNDSMITTNDSIKYLGKTEGYYFLWNKNSKASTIYPASEIKRIELKPFEFKKPEPKKTQYKNAEFNQIDIKP